MTLSEQAEIYGGVVCGTALCLNGLYQANYAQLRFGANVLLNTFTAYQMKFSPHVQNSENYGFHQKVMQPLSRFATLCCAARFFNFYQEPTINEVGFTVAPAIGMAVEEIAGRYLR